MSDLAVRRIAAQDAAREADGALHPGLSLAVLAAAIALMFLPAGIGLILLIGGGA